MARKTTGNTTANRRKKAEVPAPPAAVQVAPEVHDEARNDVRKNRTPANHVSLSLASVNLEEQIRRRAYELYLERRATAGGDTGSGDENQDWLIAEREIRSREGGQEHSA